MIHFMDDSKQEVVVIERTPRNSKQSSFYIYQCQTEVFQFFPPRQADKLNGGALNLLLLLLLLLLLSSFSKIQKQAENICNTFKSMFEVVYTKTTLENL